MKFLLVILILFGKAGNDLNEYVGIKTVDI